MLIYAAKRGLKLLVNLLLALLLVFSVLQLTPAEKPLRPLEHMVWSRLC